MTTGAVEHGERARMWSARRGFTDDERERLNAEIDAIYADFVAKVAAGRGRTVADDRAARPRPGLDGARRATSIGLVDELGGLRDAVRIARRLSGLPDDAPVTPAIHLPLVARLGQPATARIRERCWPRRCRPSPS